MAASVFVDTGAWYALIDRIDQALGNDKHFQIAGFQLPVTSARGKRRGR